MGAFPPRLSWLFFLCLLRWWSGAVRWERAASYWFIRYQEQVFIIGEGGEIDRPGVMLARVFVKTWSSQLRTYGILLIHSHFR